MAISVVTGQMQGVAARRQDADPPAFAVLPVVVIRVVVRAGLHPPVAPPPARL